MRVPTRETSVRRGWRAGVVVLSVLCAGCGGFLGSGRGGEDPETRFRAAAEAVERGRWEPGVGALRELASRCESGRWGAQALLLLAAVHVDPRNPRPSPAAGAQLAARYLQVPGSEPSSSAVARTLYLLALDLGADPVRNPFSPVPVAADRSGVRFWRVAERFGECGEGGGRSARIPLPEHPGMPLWQAVESAYRERDSLAARSAAKAEEAQRLRLRVDSLDAELDRIRSLLQRSPDAPPPGRGRP